MVIGGGAVAARKVRTLLAYGARVTVISPRCSTAIERLATAGRIAIRRRIFRARDLDGAALAIAATDDPTINAAASRQARRRGVWINVVDAPTLCTAMAPAVVRRGPLTIAISTAGTSPAVAKTIRRQLERRYGPEYAPYLRLLRAARTAVQARVADPRRRAERAAIMDRLLRSDLLRRLRRGERRRARQRVAAILVRATGANGRSSGGATPRRRS